VGYGHEKNATIRCGVRQKETGGGTVVSSPDHNRILADWQSTSRLAISTSPLGTTQHKPRASPFEIWRRPALGASRKPALSQSDGHDAAGNLPWPAAL